MPTKRLEIVIIGGSLGGLSAGLWLQNAGYSVTILERSREPLTNRGAGLGLHPECIRYLDEVVSYPYQQISIRLDKLVYLRPTSNPQVLSSPNRIRVASYNSMIAALKHHFPPSRYFLDHEVVDVQRSDEKVRVSTANGRIFHCDLLVCADGADSFARSQVFGDSLRPPKFANYVAWRGVVPQAQVSARTLELVGCSHVVHMTTDGHAISYPVWVVSDDLKDRELYINWIWYRNLGRVEVLEDLMTDKHGVQRRRSVPPGLVQEEQVRKLKDDSKCMHDAMRELLEVTKQPFLQAIFEQETTRLSLERICLLGDAAFSVRPHVGIGMAKAAMDARQLTQALVRSKENVEDALLEYEEKQGKLGMLCVHRSRELGERIQKGRWIEGSRLEVGLYEPYDSEMD